VKWLRGLKANADTHQDPDNETLVANVDKGTTESQALRPDPDR
jgi:hypothetical protein